MRPSIRRHRPLIVSPGLDVKASLLPFALPLQAACASAGISGSGGGTGGATLAAVPPSGTQAAGSDSGAGGGGGALQVVSYAGLASAWVAAPTPGMSSRATSAIETECNLFSLRHGSTVAETGGTRN